MIKLKSLTMTNFMSFGQNPTTLNLDRNDITLISGNNLDVGVGGESRNGAGKSVLFNALHWCLFDEAISDIKQDETINLFNANHMEVSVVLEIGGNEYTITRGRKPNHVELLENGAPYTRDTTRNVDESIRLLLDTNPDIFKNTVMLDANQQPFMGLKAAAQRDFMEKFLELEKLSVRARALKKFRADNSVELGLEEKMLETVRTNNTRLRQVLTELLLRKEAWDTQHHQQMEFSRARIQELLAVDVQKILQDNDEKDRLTAVVTAANNRKHVLDMQLNESNNVIAAHATAKTNLEHTEHAIVEWKEERQRTLAATQKELEEFSGVDVEGLLEMHQEQKDKTALLIKQTREGEILNDKYARLGKQLATQEAERTALLAGECPYCKQTFHDTAMLSALEGKIMNTKVEVTLTEKQATALVEETADTKSILETLATALAGKPREKDLQTSKERIAAVRVTQNRILAEVCPWEKDIESLRLKSAEWDEKSAPHYSAVTTLTEQLVALQREMQDTTQKLAAYGGILSREMASRVTVQLEEERKKLSGLEKETNPHTDNIRLQEESIRPESEVKLTELKKIGEHLDILIRLLTDSKSFIRKRVIDSYVPFLNITTNNYLEQNGSMHTLKINSDLSAQLYYMDFEVSYGSLSKGEKLRLNFAFSMALRDMKASFGHRFNVMFIDEYFDSGSDTEFFRRVFAQLSREKSGLFVISHREELKGLAQREIVVTKSGGFSSIEESVL